MNYTRLILEQSGPVAFVTLNRPDVHNAFDETLIAEMIDIFKGLVATRETRVAVLQGAGQSFCAGADLEWMQRMASYTYEENVADAAAMLEMFEQIANAPFVTIARVHGAAIGGGVGLIAACDIAIAENTALHVPSKPKQFALSEVRLGLAPAVIAPYVLRKVGMGPSHLYFLTGKRFNAEEANRIGLVQQVVEPGQIDKAIGKVIDDVLQAGPLAVEATKQLMREIDGKSPQESAPATTRVIAALRSSDEGQEGIKAFLEKRRPAFAVTGYVPPATAAPAARPTTH